MAKPRRPAPFRELGMHTPAAYLGKDAKAVFFEYTGIWGRDIPRLIKWLQKVERYRASKRKAARGKK